MWRPKHRTLSDVLYASVLDAKKLKSSTGNWSTLNFDCRKRTQKEQDEYMKARSECWKIYRCNFWTATFFNKLAANLIRHCASLKILDVGCGEGHMYKLLATGNEAQIDYVSVDILDYHRPNHIQGDAFKMALPEKYIGHFNLLIIDVTPHGRDFKLYHKYAKYMAPQHTVIFMCIGTMKTGETVLSKLNNKEILQDYFALDDDYRYFHPNIVACIDTSITNEYIGKTAALVGRDAEKFIATPTRTLVHKLLSDKCCTCSHTRV